MIAFGANKRVINGPEECTDCIPLALEHLKKPASSFRRGDESLSTAPLYDVPLETVDSSIYLEYIPPTICPTPKQVVVLQAADDVKLTPLHLGAENGHLHIVQYLCDRGIDLNPANNEGDTPLHLAARSGHLAIVTHLLQRGADKELRNSMNCTPCDDATKHGHLEIADLLQSAVVQKISGH